MKNTGPTEIDAPIHIIDAVRHKKNGFLLSRFFNIIYFYVEAETIAPCPTSQRTVSAIVVLKLRVL